jgi:sugar lactone lactonase YvrE
MTSKAQARYPADASSRGPASTLAPDRKDDFKACSGGWPGGTPDGMRCDIDGNLWCGWGMGNEALDGVHVFAPDGAKIGRIALPERCANVCFGGLKRNRLFMAASQSVYALYVNTQGAPGG